MQEPMAEGVNPTHVLHLWENTWRLLWDAVNIYLTASCHNKSTPCYGPGDTDFGGEGPLGFPRECQIFYFPPNKPNNRIVLTVRAMLQILFMH